MPLLAADIGNSHTVLGLLTDGEVLADWRIATDERRTSDEWAVLLRGLLGAGIDRVTGIVVCSTVPAVFHASAREATVRRVFRGPEPPTRIGSRAWTGRGSTTARSKL